MQIIYMDILCFNMDRHTQNYGVLRDVDTGVILRMAPNYDNNIALFARGIPAGLERTSDRLISLFYDFLDQDRRAMHIVTKLPVPNRAMIESCASQITIAVDVETVCAFVMNGSDFVQRIIVGKK